MDQLTINRQIDIIYVRLLYLINMNLYLLDNNVDIIFAFNYYCFKVLIIAKVLINFSLIPKY